MRSWIIQKTTYWKKRKDKGGKKFWFIQLHFLTRLTLEPLSHQFPNIQFYWPISQQNMTWSMIWKFLAGCIDQIYKENTTASCSEFTADEMIFKTINELMLEHRWKKTNWYKRVKMVSAQLINNLPYNCFFFYCLTGKTEVWTIITSYL